MVRFYYGLICVKSAFSAAELKTAGNVVADACFLFYIVDSLGSLERFARILARDTAGVMRFRRDGNRFNKAQHANKNCNSICTCELSTKILARWLYPYQNSSFSFDSVDSFVCALGKHNKCLITLSRREQSFCINSSKSDLWMYKSLFPCNCFVFKLY